MATLKRGDLVIVTNSSSRHKHYGKIGTITDMDRGNVYVTLRTGECICTRMAMLSPAPALDQLAEI
jgi:hypothetical protein